MDGRVSSLLPQILLVTGAIAWGLGFAGILALLGVLCSLATSRLRAVSAGVAGAAAVAAIALPLKLNILVAIASAVAICLVLEFTQNVGVACDPVRLHGPRFQPHPD